jgi:hypothetical protein
LKMEAREISFDGDCSCWGLNTKRKRNYTKNSTMLLL